MNTDAVLQEMESIISAAESVDRGFTTEECSRWVSLKAQAKTTKEKSMHVAHEGASRWVWITSS
jgi:hypothetical protein